MKSYVVDASVILKWVFRTNDDEENIENALSLLKLVENGSCQIHQPIHWLPEVIAVVCRLESKRAADVLRSLLAMNFSTIDEIETYEVAIHLSSKYHHHLFDTLYHAVALTSPGTIFVTADIQYYNKTKSEGSLMLLSDFS